MTLERELGVQLFERNNRNVQLTMTGIRFYKDAMGIVGEYNQALQRIDSLKKGTLGNLRIGIGIYEEKFLSLLLNDFHRKFPHIQVEVNQFTYSELFDGIINDNIDIAFMDSLFYSDNAKFLPKTVKFCQLFDFDYCVAVNEDNPLAKRKEILSEDMKNSTLLLFDNGIESNRERIKIAKIIPDDVVLYNGFNGLKSMLEADYGICFIPAFMKDELPPTVRMIPQKIFPSYHYFYIYSENRDKPSCKCFIQTIKRSKNLWTLWGLRKRISSTRLKKCKEQNGKMAIDIEE